MVAFLWERPLGVWHVSALAALPPTGLFLVPWLLLFFPGESVRSWMLPTTLTMKGILVFAAQDTEFLLLPFTVLGYRATVGHGTWVSSRRQDPEFLT